MTQFHKVPKVVAISTLILMILLLLVAPPVFAQLGEVEQSGYVRSYFGVLTQQEGDYAIVQNTFDLRFEKIGSQVGFHINPYIYQYPDQSLSPQGDEFEVQLRQAYMDLYFDRFDVRVGKQQIVWGKADGVFITDIVSPKDLSEFLLRDFSEIRMGVTGAKVDWYAGKSTFEFVWLPVFTPTTYAAEGSLWRPETVPQINLPLVMDLGRRDVEPTLENSELFVRYSRLSSNFDIELITGWMWEDDPTSHLFPYGVAADTITLRPEHHRLWTTGGSASTTLGAWVLTAEAAYVTGDRFQALNTSVLPEQVERDYVEWMAGISSDLFGARTAVQFIQSAILDYEDSFLDDRITNLATLLVRNDYLRETLAVELFAYIGLEEPDALVRPSLVYTIRDAVSLTLGANLFYGNEGQFGQFDNADMVYVKLRYDF